MKKGSDIRGQGSEKLGIICGLEAEAAIARRVSGAMVACSAAQPARAREQARALIRQGATKLLSFGLAGGLKPELRAGDLVISSSVCAAGQQWDCDAEWLGKLGSIFPAALCGPVGGIETIVAQASAKRVLYEQTGCVAADMESHAVADMATTMSVPFIVLRAIVDTADMNLPPAALVPLSNSGRVDALRVAQSLVKNPAQIPALVHLGINTANAMATLRHVADVLKGPS